jgi:uncharacterized protein with LGFP repeats
MYVSKHGAYATADAIGEYYELVSGSGGWLGFPVSDETPAGPPRRETGDGTRGRCQRFEGGVVYYSKKIKAVAISSSMAAYLDRHAGVAGHHGFPVSPELDAADSPYGTSGSFQRFEGDWDYPEDILEHWSDSEGPGGATIYASSTHGINTVGWGNGILYERLGGTSSWLGFPTSDETDARSSQDEPWCTIQEFEGGAIFYEQEHGSVPVSRVIMEHFTKHSRLRRRLGFPVDKERSLRSEGDKRVQFFEHGVITIRNGMIEAWQRLPEPPREQDAPRLAPPAPGPDDPRLASPDTGPDDPWRPPEPSRGPDDEGL